MAHFFNNFPSVEYDMGRVNVPLTIQNPLLRFKLQDILKGRSALYYEHIVEEDQSAQFIANRYYGDVTLDWVIFLVNDIFDYEYEWPMNYQKFNQIARRTSRIKKNKKNKLIRMLSQKRPLLK